jgi:hypothetical protein
MSRVLQGRSKRAPTEADACRGLEVSLRIRPLLEKARYRRPTTLLPWKPGRCSKLFDRDADIDGALNAISRSTTAADDGTSDGSATGPDCRADWTGDQRPTNATGHRAAYRSLRRGATGQGHAQDYRREHESDGDAERQNVHTRFPRGGEYRRQFLTAGESLARAARPTPRTFFSYRFFLFLKEGQHEF